jgi:hypothetical protein
MITSWAHLIGTLMQGHQVASRPSTAYPYSSLEKQKPYFKERGFDLSPYFVGTLNLHFHSSSGLTCIHPKLFRFRVVKSGLKKRNTKAGFIIRTLKPRKLISIIHL